MQWLPIRDSIYSTGACLRHWISNIYQNPKCLVPKFPFCVDQRDITLCSKIRGDSRPHHHRLEAWSAHRSWSACDLVPVCSCCPLSNPWIWERLSHQEDVSLSSLQITKVSINLEGNLQGDTFKVCIADQNTIVMQETLKKWIYIALERWNFKSYGYRCTILRDNSCMRKAFRPRNPFI